MKSIFIGTAIILGLWLIVSVLYMLGLYWTHYPFGRKGMRK